MCYHISFEAKLPDIIELFPDLVIDYQLEENFPTAAYINGFDHKPQQVMVTSRKDGMRHLVLMMWGFLPNTVSNLTEAEKFWNGYKDENGKWYQGYITLNAVGEEMLQSVLYRDAALNRRCIVLTDGFYEWHHHFPIGKKGQRLKTAVKYPHHIFLRNSPGVTMVAGIWTPWRHEELNAATGQVETLVTPTFAVCTTEANELMQKIHNSKKRMPVILTQELAEEWIQPGLSEERIAEIIRFQYPPEQMEAYTIARDFQQTITPKEKYVYPEFEEEWVRMEHG